MFFKKIIFVFLIGFFCTNLSAQNDSIKPKKIKKIARFQKNAKGLYNPLAPSRAAFYSAAFPGMGQIYNRKYWKAPIVWGALGTSIFFYLDNNNEFKRFRRAFRARSNGFQDEFTVINADGTTTETVSVETLERAQEQLRENRDLSLLTTAILYVLQIVEASVNAHLLQFNTDDNLTLRPTFINTPVQIETPKLGVTLKYNF